MASSRAGLAGRHVTVWGCGTSALLPGVQQCEGVLEALVEDRVGELPVGQSARELQCPAIGAETLSICTRAEFGLSGSRRAAMPYGPAGGGPIRVPTRDTVALRATSEHHGMERSSSAVTIGIPVASASMTPARSQAMPVLAGRDQLGVTCGRGRTPPQIHHGHRKTATQAASGRIGPQPAAVGVPTAFRLVRGRSRRHGTY